MQSTADSTLIYIGITPAKLVLMALQRLKSASATVPENLERFLTSMGDGWVSMVPSRENKMMQVWGRCEVGNDVKEQCSGEDGQVTATLLFKCARVQTWGMVTFPKED